MDDLLNTAPCGFLVFDDGGRIVEVNHTLRELLGHGSSDLVGSKVDAILTVASRIFYQTHFFPLIKLHGRADEIFLSLAASGGGEVPVLVNAVRKRHGNEHLNHCVALPVQRRRQYEEEILLAKKAAEDALQGNDELKRIKRELEEHARDLDRKVSSLEQKNQELARVSHVLSHDLREHIRKISWFAGVLQEETANVLSPEGTGMLERIRASCQALDQLIHALREFLSLDVAAGTIEPVDLQEVVTDALRSVRESTGAGDVRLHSTALPVVEGFRHQLALLFRNLIENAVRFRQAEVAPQIRVSCRSIQHNGFRATQGRYRYVDFAKIVFRDNSVGFDNRHSERVFDALTNVRTGASGFGFGLATCRKVVDNHHGAISAASAPGEGVTYTILLPLRREQ